MHACTSPPIVPQAPVTVAAKTHYLCELDIEKTVHNFVEHLPMFFESELWLACLADGQFMDLDLGWFHQVRGEDSEPHTHTHPITVVPESMSPSAITSSPSFPLPGGACPASPGKHILQVDPCCYRTPHAPPRPPFLHPPSHPLPDDAGAARPAQGTQLL